jgi:hypothetical protein
MRFIEWLLTPYRRWQARRRFKKSLEQLRKRDPFIYW